MGERVSVVVRFSAQRELEPFVRRTIIAYLLLTADRLSGGSGMKKATALHCGSLARPLTAKGRNSFELK
jgi:hypothetical protein